MCTCYNVCFHFHPATLSLLWCCTCTCLWHCINRKQPHKISFFFKMPVYRNNVCWLFNAAIFYITKCMCFEMYMYCLLMPYTCMSVYFIYEFTDLVLIHTMATKICRFVLINYIMFLFELYIYHLCCPLRALQW